MGRKRRRRAVMTFLAIVACAAMAGCQGMGRPQASILDECASPTFSNKDWCLSTQFPNAD